jgi:pimeloyl-ACP methyl ester carboxylesterase
VLIGSSLGAAVALQEAVDDPRVATIVAAEVFADIGSVARDRAFYLPEWVIRRAFREAEHRAGFSADAVSAVAAAPRLSVPVLVIHGAEDTDTRPEHSQRVFEALTGTKRLILVSGAGHGQALSDGTVWTVIDNWIDGALGVSTLRVAPLPGAHPLTPDAGRYSPACCTASNRTSARS